MSTKKSDKQVLKELYDFCKNVQWSPLSEHKDKYELEDPNPRSTAFPRKILKRIYALLFPNNKTKLFSSTMEAEIARKLGVNIFEWETEMAKTEKYNYKDVKLSRDVLYCFMPCLSRKMLLIGNEQVNDVIERYLPLYPDVQYFGYEEPDKYVNSQEEEQIIKINQKKSRFGFLLNTSSGQGSHWISVFADSSKQLVEVFDPLGMPPSLKFRKFYKILVTNLRKHFEWSSGKVYFSNDLVQQNSFDCGIYCTHFLIYKILRKGNLIDFLKTDLSQKQMFIYRTTYWNIT